MKLSDNQKQNIVKDYLNGISWVELCENYSTNLHTIHKILKQNNVEKNRIENNSWSIEKQELFKKMYLNNSTYKEMYDTLNCKGGTITYWVHKLNLPMRGSGRKNIYPNKFMKSSIKGDYWLGYLLADGHVGSKYRKYEIILCSEKEYVVNKYKKWYNNIPSIYKTPYTLQNGTTKILYKAHFSSKNIAMWFKDTLHIENKKHHSLNPKININWDIIRGYFDGDGSASKGWQLKTCSKIWLERVQEFMNRYGIKSTLKLSYLDCWGLYIYDKENLRKVATLMYQHKYYCHKYKYKLLEPYISNDILQTE